MNKSAPSNISKNESFFFRNIDLVRKNKMEKGIDHQSPFKKRLKYFFTLIPFHSR